MINFSKAFNQKLTARVMGEKAPYSISFISPDHDWYRVPLIEKPAKENRKTLDFVAVVPASYGQVKSDTILMVFINPITEALRSSLANFLEPDFFNSENVNELLLPILGMYRIKGGVYRISKVGTFLVGEKKFHSLRIYGEENKGLASSKYSETVIVSTENSVMIFDLILSDKDEPRFDAIISDFEKILSSLKTN